MFRPKNDKNPQEMLNLLLSHDFKSFMHKVFCTLHSGADLENNWHLDAMSESVRALCGDEIKRLIVNVPPRFLKSICYSVALPAWLLGHDPSCKIIVASYSKAISNKHSEDCQFIMNAAWYKKLFPNTKILRGANRKDKFMTSKRGFRFAASIYGTMTGEGADFIIVDDPQTPLQACSDRSRKRVVGWFQKTLMSRLNSKKNGKVIIVMQRLHAEDLSGFLLSTGAEWRQLKLSLCAECDENITIGNKIFERKQGDLLHTSRIDHKDIALVKEEMGEYGFASQYQQEPSKLQQNFIKAEWLCRYNCEDAADLNEFDCIYQSWDCAIKIKEDLNDYSVCMTWGEKDERYFLLDIWRGRLEYPILLKKVMELTEKWSPKHLIIEDKASGQQLLQELRIRYDEEVRKMGMRLVPIIPKYDKSSRLILCTSYFEQGKILLPQKAAWLKEFEDELHDFPDVKHDDQIDALTQFILWRQNILQMRNAKKKSAQCVDATAEDLAAWRISRL